MNPPTQDDWTAFKGFNGGISTCINQLADALTEYGSLSEVTLKLREVIKTWPDNQIWQDYLEIFSFMCERLDQNTIENLIENLRKVNDEFDTLDGEKRQLQEKLQNIKQEWEPIAESVCEYLKELAPKRHSPGISSFIPRSGVCPIIKDIDNYSKYKTEIDNEIQTLINEIDYQILNYPIDINRITSMRRLIKNITQLNLFQQEYANIMTGVESLDQKITAVDKNFANHRLMLIDELYKMRKSGCFALFYLLRKNQRNKLL